MACFVGGCSDDLLVSVSEGTHRERCLYGFICLSWLMRATRKVGSSVAGLTDRTDARLTLWGRGGHAVRHELLREFLRRGRRA
jgi:hypothetical protein